MSLELVPASFEETILSYLRSQEQCLEGGYGICDEFVEDLTAEEDVKAILEDLIFKVNRRITCHDRYENLKQWHNQYPLFDLNDYIPNFCIDENLISKLAFNESLLISAINLTTDSEEVEPQAVGGLCLDVQAVDGYVREKCEKPTDAELDREIFQIIQKVKAVSARKSVEEKEVDDELQEKLKEYEVFLQNEMKQNVKKFVVHMSSQFDVDSHNAGSRISTWVDRNFHTLEEKRTEYVTGPHDTINEKSLFVGLQNKKYYIRHTSSVDNIEDRKYYPLGKTKELVSEGANFILMRYLAIIQYVGKLELSAMYINGDMCRNIYECTGPQQGEVNGKEVDVCKIFRYVIEECGIEHHCVTVMTIYGRIITQEWEGCEYILNMNPLQYIQREPPSQYERLELARIWQDDMQLLSKYLDYKTNSELKMKTYMADHPEVKELIADYVQNILLLKPENIMSFTLDYFQSLFPNKMPKLSYFEENEGDDNEGDDNEDDEEIE